MRVAFLLPAVLLLLGVLLGGGGGDCPRHSARCGAEIQLLIGAAVNYHALTSEASYREVLKREFNILTPENEFKWGALGCKQREEYNFERRGCPGQFARENGLTSTGILSCGTSRSGMAGKRPVQPR